MHTIDAYAVSVIRNIFHLFQCVIVDTFSVAYDYALCYRLYKEMRIFTYYRGAGIIET